jgi:hypothetical protein
MKRHPLIKRFIHNVERQGAATHAGMSFAVARLSEGTLHIRLTEERLSGIVLLFSLLLVATFGGGCHAKQDHSATATNTNADLAMSADTNRACWLPEGYQVPPGKTVIGPIQSQDDCKFGDFVDVLVTKVDSSYLIVTNLMVVAGTDAPKDCLPVGAVAIECTREQSELMQGHGSPSQDWARLHSQVGGNAVDEVRKTLPPRGLKVLRGIEQETVYFSPSNGIAVPSRQEEQEK